MTAHAEEILPLSEQRGATWPYYALFVEVALAPGTFRAYRRPLGNNRPQSLSDSLQRIGRRVANRTSGRIGLVCRDYCREQPNPHLSRIGNEKQALRRVGQVSRFLTGSRLHGQVTADVRGGAARRWDSFRVRDYPGVERLRSTLRRYTGSILAGGHFP